MVKRIFFFLLFPLCVSAQSWEFSEIKALDENNINSDGEEVLPLLSPDGRTLYFSRVFYSGNHGGKYSGADIWVSTFDDRQKIWSRPMPASRINDKGSNAVVGVGPDGKTVYVMKTNASGKPDGIYVTKKSGTSWEKLSSVPVPALDPAGFLGFYMSPDNEVLFISMKGADSRGEEDLYVSVKGADGSWSPPKNLGSSVNTNGYEISPFLSQDKKRLYFTSNGHKGVGDADIFYCDRLYNSWDTWSAPKNIGDKLNSKGFDGYFSLYGDSIAYFASNRGGKMTNLYSVKVVPGNDVLAYGQRYLTTEETNKALGANVDRRLTFEDKNVELNSAQSELIYYIANKISLLREINVQLSVVEDNDPVLIEQRLKAIVNQMRESGLDNFRVVIANNERTKRKNPSKAIIDILLFK
jgi:hypothetical protein